MKHSRRNHTPAFKAKVALAAIKGDQTIAELSKRFDVHQNSVVQWKSQLLERAAKRLEAPQLRAPAPTLRNYTRKSAS